METLPLLAGVSRYEPSEDITSGKHGGDPMSEAAHEANKPRRTEQEERVLAFVKERGPSTCEEIATGTGIPYQSASARCASLRKSGALYPTGRHRPTSTGSPAAVLEASRCLD